MRVIENGVADFLKIILSTKFLNIFYLAPHFKKKIIFRPQNKKNIFFIWPTFKKNFFGNFVPNLYIFF